MPSPVSEGLVAIRKVDRRRAAGVVHPFDGDGRAAAFAVENLTGACEHARRQVLGRSVADLQDIVAGHAAHVRGIVGHGVVKRAGLDQHRPLPEDEVHVAAVHVVVEVAGVSAADPQPGGCVVVPTAPPIQTRGEGVVGVERRRAGLRGRQTGGQNAVERGGETGPRTERPKGVRTPGRHGRRGQQSLIARQVSAGTAGRVEGVDEKPAGLKMMHQPSGELAQKRMRAEPMVARPGRRPGDRVQAFQRQPGVAQALDELAVAALRVERTHQVGHAAIVTRAMLVNAQEQAGAH